MKNMIAVHSTLLIFSLLLTITSGYATTPMTLREAVKKTLETNPEIRGNEANRRAAEHLPSQARAGYLPSLDLRAGTGKEYLRMESQENNFFSALTGSTYYTPIETSVIFRQPIFDGFNTPRNVDKANKEVDQSTHKLSETRNINSFKATSAYVTVRRFQRLLDLANHNIKLHEQLLQQAEARLKEKTPTPEEEAEVSYGISRLEDAKNLNHDIKNNLGTAIANFNEVVGNKPGPLAQPMLPANLIPRTLDETIRLGTQTNPSVFVAKSGIEVSTSAAEATKSRFYPTVNLEVEANRNRDSSGLEGVRTNLKTMVVARFNVLSGGKDIAKRSEEVERISQAKENLRSIQGQIEKDITISWEELANTRHQQQSLREGLAPKKKARDIYLAEFKDLKKVLDAQHRYFMNKAALITADAAEDIAVARLLTTLSLLIKGLDLEKTQSPSQNPIKKIAYKQPS